MYLLLGCDGVGLSEYYESTGGADEEQYPISLSILESPTLHPAAADNQENPGKCDRSDLVAWEMERWRERTGECGGCSGWVGGMLQLCGLSGQAAVGATGPVATYAHGDRVIVI